MILNSRPLSYVSSDDTEEPLTPSHLLLGYRVLSLPDPMVDPDTDSDDDDVTREDLTRRMKHLSKTIDDFWRRWRAEYLLELREAHRHFQTPKGAANPITVGDIVIVHDENHPRGLWKLGKVEELIQGTDENVRGAVSRSTPEEIILASSKDQSNGYTLSRLGKLWTVRRLQILPGIMHHIK